MNKTHTKRNAMLGFMSVLFLLLLFGGASAVGLDLNLTNDYCNKTYSGGTEFTLSYLTQDNNGSPSGVAAADINAAVYFPVTAGNLDNKWDGNFNPTCTDTNLANSTACSITVKTPNITGDLNPLITAVDNNGGLDTNYITSCVIHSQKSCAVDWMPLIMAMIIAGILLIVAGFVATTIGNPTFSFILVIVSVAVIVITLIPTLNCAI